MWSIQGDEAPPTPEADNPDALAYYLPFHFNKDTWGIYIPVNGVSHLATRLKGEALKPGDEWRLTESKLILQEHERFHATVELVCTRAEILARRSLYREYFWSREASPHEEAMANAEALRRLNPPWLAESTRQALIRWMDGQDAGYRDYAQWLPSRAYARGKENIARYMAEALPQPAPLRADSLHSFLFRFSNWRIYRNLPIYVVDDAEDEDVGLLRPLPLDYGIRVKVHLNDHPPPHIHIESSDGKFRTRYVWPEKLPMKGNQALPGGMRKTWEQYLAKYEKDIVSQLRSQVLTQ
jgi:hypothetical protein